MTNNNIIKTRLLLIVLIVAAAGFLRFHNLGVPSLWVDEVNTVYSARGIMETGKPELPSGMIYTRGILYTTMVSLIYRFADSGEAATRIVSAIFGLLSVGLTGILARRMFNTRIGLLSSFLLAFSHFAVGWSRTARPYTLLQFMTLLSIIAFLKGFEARPGEGQPLYSRKGFWARNGLSPLWLLLFLGVIPLSFFTVHRLIIFVPAGILVYMAVRAVATGINEKQWLNKYTVAGAAAVAGAGLLWLLFPNFRESTAYFLSYVPPWAEGAPGGNRLALFFFLIDAVKFPLAFLFFLGSVQLFSRESQSGWLSFWAFSIPLILLSFVFQYRVPAYLFYVYPFFLILAAAGFIRLTDHENGVMAKSLIYTRPWMHRVFTVLLFSIFFISPWARITINIPFLLDGNTNLAVDHNEWREAAGIVKTNCAEGDMIIVDLPLMMRYYEVAADYNLNWANLGRAKLNESQDGNGRFLEVYAGVPCVETLDELKTITASGRGWIVISAFHLREPNYIPDAVRVYLITLEQRRTQKGSVYVFSWNTDEKV
jgi:4-amino-4-deoxy-L-arabinose transferase-like glycosyltransferase